MNKTEEVRSELRRIRKQNLKGFTMYENFSHVLSYSIDNDSEPVYMYIHGNTIEEMFEYLKDKAKYVNIFELGKVVIRYQKEDA